MFTIALLEPQIPPNTGNIARLCAATNTRLEVVGNIGFELTDRRLKRAGLDYWQYLNWEYHPDLDKYMSSLKRDRLHLLTTKSNVSYADRRYQPGDYLLFGSEINGIAANYLEAFSDRCCTVPMSNPNVRSLNLSSTVAIALYEALRQTGEMNLLRKEI